MVIEFVLRKPKYDGNHDKEYMVKAMMLVKFCQHTQWPLSTCVGDAKTINICVAGRNPFSEKAKSVFSEASNTERQYRLLKGHAYKKQFCHIVFICDCNPEDIESVIHELKSTPTLVVSDVPGFARMGGDIELIMIIKSNKNQRVNLILNERSASEKGLILDREMKVNGITTVTRKSN